MELMLNDLPTSFPDLVLDEGVGDSWKVLFDTHIRPLDTPAARVGAWLDPRITPISMIDAIGDEMLDDLITVIKIHGLEAALSDDELQEAVYEEMLDFKNMALVERGVMSPTGTPYGHFASRKRHRDHPNC
eukprot:TRINITY_DN3344_c0_g1_i2.p1 TRINITY_DN3344_c0_g1~~TRINITY_DN3344_c0_g1_i2.p1  ORF type:complete len:131 (-),score=45.58 TRINITY_DN3344_c0_g1_i2:245-637(-)